LTAGLSIRESASEPPINPVPMMETLSNR